VTNHVNILEIPIIFTQLQPRPVTGLVLARRWDNPLLRWLLEVVGAIPLRRGEADLTAMRRAMSALDESNIVIIAPEGTRSGHGRLQRAHPGAVLLALRSGAPLMPVVFYGSERYQENLRRLRRIDFHIRVGNLFRIDPGGVKVTRQVRRQMIDEVMYQLAALLPPAYRGEYDDLDVATNRYIT
jgi:1-acyl-sn-glycerol-3-phosphate acyltransferase